MAYLTFALANPFATALWELATLKFHVHPSLSTQVERASTLKPPQLPRENPDNVYKSMLSDMSELYIPFQVSKKKHPLRASIDKNKRQRSQIRFITPRETNNWHLK